MGNFLASFMSMIITVIQEVACEPLFILNREGIQGEKKQIFSTWRIEYQGDNK